MLRAAPVALSLLLLACGGEAPEADPDAALERARAALAAGDGSDALLAVREGLSAGAGSPALRLAGAEACLALGRYADALEHAAAGLESGDPDATLEADLHWIRGKTLMGRVRDLAGPKDWADANAALERGTRGSHRIESAFLLAMLQDLPGGGSDARQLKFARIVLDEAPDSERAATLREYLATKGLSP